MNDDAVSGLLEQARGPLGTPRGGRISQLFRGRFQVRNEQIADLVPPLVKAAPDAIMSAREVITRALLKATWTIPIMGGPRIEALEKQRARRPPQSEHL